MNLQELDASGQWFEDYLRRFADGQGILEPMLQIKAEHSRRVAGIMETITRDLGLRAADVRTAYVLGLLHDVGRFSQYSQFHTYNDRISINHGRHGAEIVKKFKVLTGLVPEDRMRIVPGIRHHNEYQLPDALEDGALLFVKIIRDADKLDICRSMMTLWENGELLKYIDPAANIDLKGPPNPMVLAALRAGRTVPYCHIKSMADFFMTLLSWVYDLNFTGSYRRMTEGGLLEKIAAQLPMESKVQEAAAQAIRYSHQQLQNNISG